MKTRILQITLGLLLSTVTAGADPLGYSAVKTANPLKGFMPFAGNHPNAIQHSMEFFYLPLRDLMVAPDRFDWNPLETKLNEISARRHQSVFRVYLDYPKKPSGIPGFLLNGADKLPTRNYEDHGNKGVSLSPDYNNPALRAALKNFIAALGERYDGDPRIGFLQIGLLGFWGEWHTFPHNEWMPPLPVQEEILAAFDSAFERTPLLVREPKDAAFAKYSIGYHDDSFAYTTLAPPDWHFQGRLAAYGETERWKTRPIGGEVRPEIQPGLWEDPSSVPKGQEFIRCVETIRPSWMLANGAFVRKLSPPARKLAEQHSRKLGYEFHVVSADLSNPSPITATIRNTGVTPFYHDWPLELAFLDASGRIAHTARTDWKLTGLLPGDPDRSWSHTIQAGTLTAGTYRVLLRAVNPLENGLLLRFANEAQDADLEGWLTLGKIRF